MKKRVVLIAVVAVLTAGSVGVFAYNGFRAADMDPETFVETRTSQVEEALLEGTISQEQADLLIAHINDMVASEEFGTGLGNKGEGNSECVLGEDGNLGIFRNENAGQGNRGSQSRGNQNGGQQRGNGQRGNQSGECILD